MAIWGKTEGKRGRDWGLGIRARWSREAWSHGIKKPAASTPRLLSQADAGGPDSFAIGVPSGTKRAPAARMLGTGSFSARFGPKMCLSLGPKEHPIFAGFAAKIGHPVNGYPGRLVSRVTARLGVLLHIGRKINRHEGLISHDPGIVARRNAGEVTRPQVDLATVIWDDPQLAADDVLEVLHLTTFRVHVWADMLRPLPAGLQREPGEVVSSRVASSSFP